MENIQETPVKGSRKGYHSDADSGDDLFNEIDTVPTLPWKRETAQESVLSSYPAVRSTQPTQLLEQHQVLVPQSSSPAPQISSPPRHVPPPRPQQQSGGRLASVMAPPGTAYRAPIMAQHVPAKAMPVIDISDDDGMPYVGDSDSDDEHARKNDIKPAVLKSRQQQPVPQSGYDKFAAVVGKSYFTGLTSINTKRPAESPVASPRPNKQNRQQDEIEDITIDDIEDFQERRKISRMHDILPRYSIKELMHALRRRRGNADDAMDLLATEEEQGATAIDLTNDSGEDELSQAPAQRKPLAKQTLTKPTKTIKQKYTETRPPVASQSTHNLLSISDEQSKPKRKLVRGRKLPSPPRSSSPLVKPVSRDVTPLKDDSESDAELEPASPTVVPGSLLSFFNTCSAANLMDLASISKEHADEILANKPFKSLSAIRKIEGAATKSSSRKKVKPLGEKVVEMCEEMFEGYEAVDALLARCEAISQPVMRELARWGVDLNGAANDGGIGIASAAESDPAAKDSGMRTPISLTNSDEDNDIRTLSAKKKVAPRNFTQPANLAEGVELKDYQKIGVEWLTLLFKNRLSCILADDMGLGKTCQVISFLARLQSMNETGPHIIIVPASTLENWLREFQTFCPSMLVMPYYGSQSERLEIQVSIEESEPYVLVTTYDIAKKKDDRKFLTRLEPTVCVFDEGHALKNSQTKAYQQLMRLDCKFRVLLTGTPLQNNLKELASLLGFILPKVFSEHEEQLSSIFRHRATTTAAKTHDALLSEERINKARSMMAPFVLRRKKQQVLKHIPPKTLRIEYCDMTPTQQTLYDEQFQRLKAEAASTTKKPGKRENVLMTLRQAAIHPWLFRRAYDDKVLAKIAKDYVKQLPQSTYELVLEDLSVMTDSELYHMTAYDEDVSPFLSKYTPKGEPWMDSGKVDKLVSLLLDYRAAGDRVLVFSQFKLVLDVLEYVMETIQVKFFRLDGSTKIEERQELLDEFYEKPEVTCFMLSTKAGGAGINLACANKVIIFDQSFNPQDDVQAENRAHRLGQTRPVEVVRLVSRGTVEEQILALGATKLALDSRVAGEEDEHDAKAMEKLEKEGQARVKEMLLSGGADVKTAEGEPR